MLGIVGDPIDPGRLSYSSLTQDEDVHVLLVMHDLQIQSQQKIISRKEGRKEGRKRVYFTRVTRNSN